MKDFHFDVPRGYLVVNGNEYKLVDLDKNPENGEELQLSKENVGFPEGNDRTNVAAYKKVAENQFTYNEGSLNYTLTGAAFHDNDNDGIPDGVRIIGPKPCFGPGFDTSIDNFHFKVPSGVLIVNGQNYQLAELDDNPDNGYELVIPEIKLGWQKIDGGWSYTQPSDNDPDTVGTLKFYAENFDTTGVTFPVIRMLDMSEGLNERVTQFVVKGLKGVVNLNNPNYPIGIYDADNYGLTITKHGDSIIEYRLSEVAPNATIAIHSDVTFIDTIGNGSINVLSNNMPFVLNGQKIEVQGEKYLTIDLASSQIINEEVLGWKKVGKKFEYVGRPSNDPTQVVSFTINGKNIKDADKDGKPDGVEVDVLRKGSFGIRAGIKGLNGEVFLNGKSIGVKNDVDYSIHFAAVIDPNISPELMDLVKGFELINISPGAKINSPGSCVILGSEGTYHFSDGEYLVADKPAHSPSELQKMQKIVVSNRGKGAEVTLKDGIILANENVSLVDGAFFVDESEHVENRDVDMFGEPLRVSTGGGENVSDSNSVEIVENSSDVTVEIYNEPENVEDQTADFSEKVDEDLNDLTVSDVEETAIEKLTNRFNADIFEDIIDDFKTDLLDEFAFLNDMNSPGLINNPAQNMSNLNLEMDEFKLLETASFIYNNSKNS